MSRQGDPIKPSSRTFGGNTRESTNISTGANTSGHNKRGDKVHKHNNNAVTNHGTNTSQDVSSTV